ncbi:hypothetical protein [Oryzomonas rubra]|uniref:DUF5610 domain-containing protein n=1 Tax=Oryzomonas rubra TaxID=2509454 RepID=A0A5A9X7F2_9BACT|nr:hypothetical protein [Oryzomonas rubra]KAA0889007.1 hypothetical protein ET418_14225 [Oryzomonas rubra]
MSIAGISSSSSSFFAKIALDFQDISTALQSGNMTDAQQAYAALASDKAAQLGTSSTDSVDNDSNSPMAQDIQSLGSALQSGSLTDAQNALDKIQQHMEGQGEFAKQQMDLASLLSTDSTAAADSTSSSDTNPLVQDFQALSAALTSGNLSDAQTAFATLQQDVSSQNGGQSDDPFSQDIQSLGSALQSGNLTDAQQVFSRIEDKLSSPPPEQPEGVAPPPSSTQTSGDTQDTVAQTLQALLDALDRASSSSAATASATTDTGSDNSVASLQALLSSALKDYLQLSSNSYAHDAENTSQISSATV